MFLIDRPWRSSFYLACYRRSDSGEQCEVKRIAKNYIPSPPLLFSAFFTSHRSPLSLCLEQASYYRVIVNILTGFVQVWASYFFFGRSTQLAKVLNLFWALTYMVLLKGLCYGCLVHCVNVPNQDLSILRRVRRRLRDFLNAKWCTRVNQRQ